MAKLPASLFNDVIGPVMRGPSSSHVAGAARIGALVRQSLGGDVRSVLVEFDVNGRPEKRRRSVPARGLRETTLGGVSAIVPYVSCSDVHITGFNHLIVEENDKLKNGFVSW